MTPPPCRWGTYCHHPAAAYVTAPTAGSPSLPACQTCIDRWLLHDRILQRIDSGAS